MRLSQLPRCRFDFVLTLLVLCLSPSCAHAVPLQTVTYTSIPGIPQNQLAIDLYPCPTSADALVVYIHGGAWIAGDKKNVHSMPGFFLKNNICFASANYPLRTIPGESLFDLQVDALSRLDNWLHLLHPQYFPTAANRNISIIGHSAGAHLVALLDKRKGWSNDVKSIILMDSGAYDISAKYLESPPQYKDLMGQLLRLSDHHPDEYEQVFWAYSPALLHPKPRSSPLGVYLLAGQDKVSRSSALLLQKSYSLLPVYNAVVYAMPWRHADFPKRIGTDPVFSQKLLVKVLNKGR